MNDVDQKFFCKNFLYAVVILSLSCKKKFQEAQKVFLCG
jgi:hypothetical protein